MSAKDSNRLPVNRPLDQPQGKKDELRCFSTSGEQSGQEARYTQLFETLEEGVYFCTPEGKILDANPALVRMLGYANKEELLRTNVNNLYLEPDWRRALLLELEQKTTIRDREITPLATRARSPSSCSMWTTSSASTILSAMRRVTPWATSCYAAPAVKTLPAGTAAMSSRPS